MTFKDKVPEPESISEVPLVRHHEDGKTVEDEARVLDQDVKPSMGASTSKKRKKKVPKTPHALSGKSEIPEELVNELLDKVAADGSVPEEKLTIENITEALVRLKTMNISFVQGKVVHGEPNKKDMGGHKVIDSLLALKLMY